MKKSISKGAFFISCIIFCGIFIILLTGFVAAEEIPFDKNNPESWKYGTSEEKKSISVDNLLKYPEQTKERPFWKELSREQVQLFLKENARQLSGQNINFEGFENLFWGEGEVIGNTKTFASLDRLPKNLEGISYDKDKGTLSYKFKNGGTITTDNQWVSEELGIYNVKEDGSVELQGSWNSKGKISFSGKEIKLEEGSQFTKSINKHEVAFSQFYYKNNPTEDYRPEGGSDEAGILRLNEGGYLEGKNIKASVEGIDFYTAREGFISFKGNLLSELSEGVVSGALSKLFGGSSGDSFIKADLEKGKVKIDVQGSRFSFVDVSSSSNTIEEFSAKPSMDKDNSVYLKNGDSVLKFNKDKILNDYGIRNANIEMNLVKNSNNPSEKDFFVFKNYEGRLLLYSSDDWLNSRAVITHGPRWNTGKKVDATVQGSKTAGSTEYGEFIITNVGRREMPLKDMWDEFSTGIEQEISKAAQENGLTVEQLVKLAQSPAGAVMSSLKAASPEDIEFLKNYDQAKQAINNWRYQYPAISPYSQLRLSQNSLIINGREVDTEGLSPSILAKLNQGANDQGVRSQSFSVIQGLSKIKAYKSGVR